MTSVQDRLQPKREPVDEWSLREQLCLASAVSRSGDQNWMSVSRALKPFGETNRPSDWFHQKNCAAQYAALLENVETPRRKQNSDVETVAETHVESIFRRLLSDRQIELQRYLAEEKTEYKILQEEIKLLHTGRVSEEMLDKWSKEIDEGESKREEEAVNHAKWLKQRDLRKQEIERAWRSVKPPLPVVAQKRKCPDIIDDFINNEREINAQVKTLDTTAHYQQYIPASQQQCQQQHFTQHYPQEIILQHEIQHQPLEQLTHMQPQEAAKQALSPLLTSLLKSPSQVPNLPAVPILQTVISNQNNVESENSSSPTIASLLNFTDDGTTASSSLNESLKQFSISGMNQQQTPDLPNDDSSQPLDANILDDANIKIDDLAKSILVQDGPFPEIRKEEVDDIISEIIENAHDIVTDPDQHLELDGNGDININLELDELEEQSSEMNDEVSKIGSNEDSKLNDKFQQLPAPVIDPFEFQEDDPVLFESPVKPSSLKQDNFQYVPLYQNSPMKCVEEITKQNTDITMEINATSTDKNTTNNTKSNDTNNLSKNVHGSVEIVEVPSDEFENEKELDKAQICDIVHSNNKKEDNRDIGVAQELCQSNIKETVHKYESISSDNNDGELKKAAGLYFEQNAAVQNINNENLASLSSSDDISNYVDDLYDNINMEVKIDKTGKAKRDYSRTKKKEGKCVDVLLNAIERANFDDIHNDMSDDLSTKYKVDSLKRETNNVRLKSSENERSSSPWTEEEDEPLKANKIRYSTPGTPVDSLPNSPASSVVYYDDDKDYRNWKKSVMLVYNRLSSNKYASLFLKPINDDQAPGYSSVVFRPMDLHTIKKYIDNGSIRTSLEFKRHVMLMFTNAIMYNKTNDTVYKMALQMQQESISPIEILLDAEGPVDAPIRRETRTSESNCKRKRFTEESIKNKRKKDE